MSSRSKKSPLSNRGSVTAFGCGLSVPCCLRTSRLDFLAALLGIDQISRMSTLECQYNYVHIQGSVKIFLRLTSTICSKYTSTVGMEHRLPRHNFFNSRDEISFTCHRRSPSTKRANSTRSAARNQLFPEAKMVTGSSAARSVQLNGISHWRPFLSRKQTRCSPPYSFHVRASNSRPESG